TPLLQALCLAQLVLLALDADERRQAGELAARARGLIAPESAGRQPLCALVLATGAFAHAQAGRGEQAREELTRAERLLPATGALPPWAEAELRFALARTLLALSDAAAARRQLARMSRALRALPDATVLHGWIDDAWARADAFAASA